MSISEVSTQPAIVPNVGWSRAKGSTVNTEPENSEVLHRIRTVREQQGVSLRSIARGRRVSLRQARREESPYSDLRLSTIYRWQSYLEVPVADLLVENQEPLSRPVMERARMVKLMKTIVTIRERSRDDEITRLADTLFEQAVEIMPELADVQPWQSVGQRRTLDELGRVVERQMPDDFFSRPGC